MSVIDLGALFAQTRKAIQIPDELLRIVVYDYCPWTRPNPPRMQESYAGSEYIMALWKRTQYAPFCRQWIDWESQLFQSRVPRVKLRTHWRNNAYEEMFCRASVIELRPEIGAVVVKICRTDFEQCKSECNTGPLARTIRGRDYGYEIALQHILDLMDQSFRLDTIVLYGGSFYLGNLDNTFRLLVDR